MMNKRQKTSQQRTRQSRRKPGVHKVVRGDPHNNLVVVSDLHCGDALGLFPNKTLHLSDSKEIGPSKFQKKLLSMWEEFWNVFVPAETCGEPYCVIVNGDAIDGVHHGSTNQITHNMADQVEIAYQILQPIRDRCDGRLYLVRGTEAHVGKSGAFEELLASRLEAVPDSTGIRSHYRIKKKVGKGLAHFLHHVGTTSSAAHEASAVNAEMTAEFVEAARWCKQPPNFVVRSHRHRNIEVAIPTAFGTSRGIVTPAWQGKGPFVYRVPLGRLAPPQFGGVVIRQGEHHLYAVSRVWALDDEEVF